VKEYFLAFHRGRRGVGGFLDGDANGFAIVGDTRLTACLISRADLHGMSGRKCMLTGKKANNAIQLSFSHIRTKILQQPNLQVRTGEAKGGGNPRP